MGAGDQCVHLLGRARDHRLDAAVRAMRTQPVMPSAWACSIIHAR